MLAAGMPEWLVTAILQLQDYYRTGKGGAVTDTLPRLLGRPSTPLASFLQDQRSAFL
jgi:hypothetical protein